MIDIQWKNKQGKVRITSLKPETASRYIIVLQMAGFEWKIV
mgnify:FL=1